MASQIRIDKFLWAIRAFKTRTEASEACKGNRVKIAGVSVKASKYVEIGDLIELRKGAILYTYKVKALLASRVSAKLVEEYVENLTPETELNKLKSPVETFFIKRDRGTGRPTKKERRDLDDMVSNIDYSSYDEEIPDDIAELFGISEDDKF